MSLAQALLLRPQGALALISCQPQSGLIAAPQQDPARFFRIKPFRPQIPLDKDFYEHTIEVSI